MSNLGLCVLSGGVGPQGLSRGPSPRNPLPALPQVCVLSCFSCVALFASLWTVARQAPLSTGFSRQEHWRGLPCPPPRDLPDPGLEPTSLLSPALAGGFFTTCATWETWCTVVLQKCLLSRFAFISPACGQNGLIGGMCAVLSHFSRV